MKKIQLFITSIILLLAIHSSAVAQSSKITDTFKKHFNETVQKVQEEENPTERRSILNKSYNNMITALEHIETKANLTDEELNQLHSYKSGIVEKQNELNGFDGFSEVQDEDLLEFSEYSQQYFEQANRTVTLSVSTALVIIIIILLLA